MENTDNPETAKSWSEMTNLERNVWIATYLMYYVAIPHRFPQFVNDLNLIHEAEAAVLKLVSWPDYVAALSEVAGGITTAIRATAAQRAEACWRVMRPKEKAESVPSRVWRRDRERFSELYPFGIDGHCPEIE